jgi:MoaA/NifB/PqqE/SkfB family radical SAM enzyme
MYNLEDIEAVHMEISEKCNVSCLMCDRNISGGKVNPYLKGRTLPFKVIKKAFKPDIIQQLNRVDFCGNYGDPILANSLMPTLKYFKQHNKNTKLGIITNGCSRAIHWWQELATLTSSVRFGIDGLSDTHKIYRQNSIWSLIIRNAKAYIDAGGYAIWDYLVFGHNDHQIEKARKLSEELGFKEFIVKKTGRFFSNTKLKGKDEHKGLTKPESEKHINKSLKKEREIIKKHGSMKEYLDQTKINCKVLNKKEIYISAEGVVLPCCWLAGQMYKWYLPEKSTQIWELMDKKDLNIYNSSIQEIFNSGIFDEIQETWSRPTVRSGKLSTCALKCGKELDQFGDQYK